MCYPWRGYFQGTFLIFFWVVFNFVTFLIFFWQLPIGIYTNITTKLALDSHNEYFGIKLIDTGENQWLSVSKSQWRDVATPDIFCTTPILQHFEIWKNIKIACTQCIKVINTGESQWLSVFTSQWRDVTTPTQRSSSHMFKRYHFHFLSSIHTNLLTNLYFHFLCYTPSSIFCTCQKCFSTNNSSICAGLWGDFCEALHHQHKPGWLETKW